MPFFLLLKDLPPKQNKSVLCLYYTTPPRLVRIDLEDSLFIPAGKQIAKRYQKQNLEKHPLNDDRNHLEKFAKGL